MRGWRRRLSHDRAKTLRGASYYIKLLLHLRDFENFDFGGTYGGQIDFGGPKPKNPIRPIVFLWGLLQGIWLQSQDFACSLRSDGLTQRFWAQNDLEISWNNI